MNPQADDSAESRKASYATALRLLARREHSEFELRRKLSGRHFPDTVVDAVVTDLANRGLLSDRRFAEVYARGRSERGYGPLRIEAELRERGISGDFTRQMLAGLSTSWIESAARQRSKRFGHRLPSDYHERTAQMRFLHQRGFTLDQIQAVFDVTQSPSKSWQDA